MAGENRARNSRGGFGTHIRIWMLVVGIVPLLILFLYGYLAARDALIEASDAHLISVVGARRAQIESWLLERLTDVEVIGRSQDCINLVRQATSGEEHARVCQYLDSFRAGAGDYQALAIYDLNWNWVAAQTGSERHRETLADSALRTELSREPGPVMSPVHQHEALPAGLHLGGKLAPPGQAPVGFVVASVDLFGTFSPILADRAGLGRTGQVLLADTTGRILHEAARFSTGRRRLDDRILNATRDANTGAVHLSGPSQSTFAGFTVLPEQNWILVAKMDEREALSLLQPLQRGFIIAGLVTLLTVVLLSARSSRRLSEPLTTLATSVRRIAQEGRFEHVPELKGREVAAVGQAFNDMIDALEEIQRERIQAGALAALGELSSNVVHEMRNRLSSVKMNLQALLRRVDDEPAYAELAGIALEQVRRTEEALTELLGFVRPVSPATESIPLDEFLEDIGGRFMAEAKANDLRLRTEDRTSGSRLVADRRLLEEAVSNLVRNAIEVTPSGGVVTLRAVSGAEGSALLSIEVEDEGPGFGGVSPEELFRPFFTTKERGSGLGLAHARKIAELHRGSLDAKETSGGALFRLNLPRKRVNS